jgi:hypothetical protein
MSSHEIAVHRSLILATIYLIPIVAHDHTPRKDLTRSMNFLYTWNPTLIEPEEFWPFFIWHWKFEHAYASHALRLNMSSTATDLRTNQVTHNVWSWSKCTQQSKSVATTSHGDGVWQRLHSETLNRTVQSLTLLPFSHAITLSVTIFAVKIYKL